MGARAARAGAQRYLGGIAGDELQVLERETAARFEGIGRTQDQQLLGGLFKRRGPTPCGQLVPQALVDRVLSLQADYRAEHR